MEILLYTTVIFALFLLYTKENGESRGNFVLTAVKSEKLQLDFCAIVPNPLIAAPS